MKEIDAFKWAREAVEKKIAALPDGHWAKPGFADTEHGKRFFAQLGERKKKAPNADVTGLAPGKDDK